MPDCGMTRLRHTAGSDCGKVSAIEGPESEWKKMHPNERANHPHIANFKRIKYKYAPTGRLHGS